MFFPVSQTHLGPHCVWVLFYALTFCYFSHWYGRIYVLNYHASLEKPKIVCVRKHGTNVGALWYGFKAAGFYQGLERLMHKTLTVYSGKLLVETILMVKLFRTKHLFSNL